MVDVDVYGKMLSTLPEDDDHPYRSGPWRPQHIEYDADELQVEGDLPGDLYGVYLRNTENPLHPAIVRYHPFDGDGMIHKVSFRDGNVSYRNRFVRTDGLLAEQEAGRSLWAGIAENPNASTRPDGWGARGRMKDAASTDVVVHAGVAVASFWQCGDLYLLDPLTLDDLGKCTSGGSFPHKDRADALTSALSGVSTLKLKAIRCESDAHGSNTGFMAHVDVLGRPHVLACEVKAEGQPTVLRETLLHLHDGEAELEPNVTRVLIAPYLSPQAQALCMQNHAGYLDLVGNARIEIGEVFIRQRMLQNVDGWRQGFRSPRLPRRAAIATAHAAPIPPTSPPRRERGLTCFLTLFVIVGKSRSGKASEGREALSTAGQETGGTSFVRLLTPPSPPSPLTPMPYQISKITGIIIGRRPVDF